jgi:hypothetical protein
VKKSSSVCLKTAIAKFVSQMRLSPKPALHRRTKNRCACRRALATLQNPSGNYPRNGKLRVSNIVLRLIKRPQYKRPHFGFSTVREIALRQVETGAGVADVFTKFEVNAWTSYYWKQPYAGLGLGRIRRLM